MTDSPKSVTCAERVRMNAIAALLFIVGGDGIILVSVLNKSPDAFGSVLSGVCGIAAMLIGFYYMLCFLNKRITVSEDGVVYVNWMGRRQSYSWDQVQASHHAGRNAYFIFDLAGKRVKFYGYSLNAQALHDFLMEHRLYDDDTMRAQERAREEREERIRLMQKQASTDDFEDD